MIDVLKIGFGFTTLSLVIYGAHGQPPQPVNGFPDKSTTLMKIIDSQSSNCVYLHMRLVGHTFLYSWKNLIIIKIQNELNIKIKELT